ncbi:transcriptional regulator [Arcanobacterium hippocoleae]
MPTHYLTLHGFAVRIGIAYSSIRKYQADGRLPEPDAILGEGKAVKYGWLPETIDKWQSARPGRGRSWNKD